jgi:FHA domain
MQQRGGYVSIQVNGDGFVRLDQLAGMGRAALLHELHETPVLIVLSDEPDLGGSEGKEDTPPDLITLIQSKPGETRRYAGLVALIQKRPGNPFGDMIFLGRTRACDLTVNLSTVSKLHAYLTCSRGSWHVVDKGSTNGTFVGEARLAPNQPTLITSGQHLRFGDLETTFTNPSGLVSALDAAGLLTT